MVMSSLTSHLQRAYLFKRQTLDRVLVPNKCLDDKIKKIQNGILYKLDLKKAYDNVSWNFLYCMMCRMDFREK